MRDETRTTPDNPADLMRLWSDMVTHATEACQTWAGAAASPDATRQTRSDLFKVWSDSWEQFLRSSSFLETQKRYMSGNVELQNKSREYLGWLHHQLQLASSQDIDQVMVAMRRMGEDLRDQFEHVGKRLDKLSAQVDGLSTRLGALEAKTPGASAPAPVEVIGDGQNA